MKEKKLFYLEKLAILQKRLAINTGKPRTKISQCLKKCYGLHEYYFLFI